MNTSGNTAPPGTAEDFEENYLSVLNSLGAEKITVKDRKVSLENETQFLSYTVCYETKKAGTIENACQVRIISDGDGLHLEYSPSLILADYEEGDRVSIITLPGRRGEIFTSDGTVIASNDYAETVYIQVDSELNIAGTISSLTDQLELSDEEAQSIKKKYDSALENNYAHVIVKAFVKGRLTSAQKEALEGIEGVGIDTDSMTLQRYYPYGEIFCHITGYTGAPSEEEAAALAEKGFPNATLVGKDGLEKTYDEVLQGRDGIASSFPPRTASLNLSSASSPLKMDRISTFRSVPGCSRRPITRWPPPSKRNRPGHPSF